MTNRIAFPSPVATDSSLPDLPSADQGFLSGAQRAAVKTLIQMVELSRKQTSYGGPGSAPRL